MPVETAAGRRRRASHRPRRPAASGRRPGRPCRARSGARSPASALVIGALFLAASLTPSLIPRSFLLQGVLGRRLLRHRLRRRRAAARGSGRTSSCRSPSDRLRRTLTWAAAAVAAVDRRRLLLARRRVAELDPRARWTCRRSRPRRPIEVDGDRRRRLRRPACCSARLFARVFAPRRAPASARYVPERVSRVVGIAVAVAAVPAASSTACCSAPSCASPTSSFADPRRADRARRTRRRPTRSAPAAPPRWSTGTSSAAPGASSSPPARPPSDIAAFTGRPAKRPVRVYVGLNSADDHRGRARSSPSTR